MFPETPESIKHYVTLFLVVLADTCYILSFSVIMLNTSLHNPNVKDKPPFERFVSMNRGINDGGDLHEGLLRVRIGLISCSCKSRERGHLNDGWTCV